MLFFLLDFVCADHDFNGGTVPMLRGGEPPVPRGGDGERHLLYSKTGGGAL
jgi:hypothetical protein